MHSGQHLSVVRAGVPLQERGRLSPFADRHHARCVLDPEGPALRRADDTGFLVLSAASKQSGTHIRIARTDDRFPVIPATND